MYILGFAACTLIVNSSTIGTDKVSRLQATGTRYDGEYVGAYKKTL